MKKANRNKQKHKSWEVVEAEPPLTAGALAVSKPARRAYRPTGIGGWIFSICFFVTLSGFVLLGVWHSTMNLASDLLGTNTSGTVIQKHSSEDSENQTKYSADFSFKVASFTEKAACDLDSASHSKIREGGTVPVRYWSGLPACSAYINLPGFLHLNPGLILATLLGLTLWLFCAFYLTADLVTHLVGWYRALFKRA